MFDALPTTDFLTVRGTLAVLFILGSVCFSSWTIGYNLVSLLVNISLFKKILARYQFI